MTTILPPTALDLQNPQPGIYRNLPFETYVAIPALNQTQLKAVAKSPAHAKAEGASTEALAFGALVHTMILEPTETLKRYTIWNEGQRGNSRAGNKFKAYEFGIEHGLESFEGSVRSWEGSVSSKTAKAAREELNEPAILLAPDDFAEVRELVAENQGKEIVGMTTYGKAMMLADAIAPDFAGNGLFKYLGAIGEVEITLIWEDVVNGVEFLCKARLDKVIPPHEDNLRTTIFDLKSCLDCTPEAFANACRRYRYEIQAPWYCRGWEILTGEKLSNVDFIFGALEKSTGISAGHWLSEEAFHHGHTCILDLLNTWADCQRHDRWPGPQAEELNYLPSGWESPIGDAPEADETLEPQYLN